MQVNKGINVAGNASVTAGAIAVGDNARAHARDVQVQVAGTATEEAAQRLAELVDALQRHAAGVEGADDLLESTIAVGDELRKEKPNRTTIKGILSAIAEAATSVTAVTAAVTALRVALGF
jgi:precorrin-2 methylase